MTKSLSGRLVQSLVSGFVIHLRISLSEVEGDAFMGALGVDQMEDHPVVKIVGINYRSTIGLDSQSKNLERFLGCKMIITLFL